VFPNLTPAYGWISVVLSNTLPKSLCSPYNIGGLFIEKMEGIFLRPHFSSMKIKRYTVDFGFTGSLKITSDRCDFPTASTTDS